MAPAPPATQRPRAPKNKNKNRSKTPAPSADTLKTIFIDPTCVVADDSFNGRYRPHNASHVAEMVKSLKEVGQVHPVRVVASVGGKYGLVSGFLRHAAGLKMPKGFQLRAEVVDISPAKAFESNIAENAIRQNTSAADDVVNVARLRKARKTLKEIAALYGKSEAWAKQTSTLARLAPELLKKLADGKLTRASALTLVSQPEPEQKKLASNAAGKSGKIDDAQIAEAIRNKAQTSPKAADTSKVQKSGSTATRRRTVADLRKTLGKLTEYQYKKPAVEKKIKTITDTLDKYLAGRASEKSLIEAIEAAAGAA